MSQKVLGGYFLNTNVGDNNKHQYCDISPVFCTVVAMEASVAAWQRLRQLIIRAVAARSAGTARRNGWTSDVFGKVTPV